MIIVQGLFLFRFNYYYFTVIIFIYLIQVPEIFAEFSLLRVFSVDVNYPATLTAMFRDTILQPLVQSMAEEDIDQV